MNLCVYYSFLKIGKSSSSSCPLKGPLLEATLNERVDEYLRPYCEYVANDTRRRVVMQLELERSRVPEVLESHHV